MASYGIVPDSQDTGAVITVDWDHVDGETIVPALYESFDNAPPEAPRLQGGEYHAFYSRGHRFAPIKRACLANVTIRGDSGAITAGNQRVHYDSAALLASPWWFNYSHFVLDMVPMLKILDGTRFDVLLVPPNTAAPQLLALLDLQAPPRFLSPGDAIGVRKLWLTSPIGPPSMKPSWVVDYLRESLLGSTLCTSCDERIWIDRNDTAHRNLVTDGSLDSELKNMGFARITASRLSVRDQIRLFAGAGLVCGVHGAGFTNVVFCPDPSGLLEFFDPYWLNGSFRIICEHRGINWGFALGTNHTDRRKCFDRDVKLDCMSIVERVARFAAGETSGSSVTVSNDF